jgi:hypothetical protein
MDTGSACTNLKRQVAETFTPESTIRDVVGRLGERGRELLYRHGYDVGEGFTDVLSQYQSLEHAGRAERLRDVQALVAELNSDH